MGDKFARNFRAGAEATGADPPARQFLRDHRHRQLAHAKPAMAFRNAHAEHAERGHLGDHCVGDQRVGEMPCMRMRRDLFGGEGAEAGSHQIERLVAERLVRSLSLRQQAGKRSAGFSCAAVGKEPRHRRLARQRARLGLAPEGGRPHYLARAHRQPKSELTERLAQPDPQRQFFRVAEPPCRLGPRGPVRGRLDRSESRSGPGKAVDRVLLAFKQRRIRRARGGDPRRQPGPHRFAIAARCPDRGARIDDPFVHGRIASRAAGVRRTRKSAKRQGCTKRMLPLGYTVTRKVRGCAIKRLQRVAPAQGLRHFCRWNCRKRQPNSNKVG